MATLTLLLAIGLVGAAGTIGALVAGQARIEAAHARELRVSQMAAESAIQTQLVDRDLTRYEAALAELVGAAQLVLSKLPASDATPYFDESFAGKEAAPPDLGPSKRYGRDVSVLAPLTSARPRRRARARSSRWRDRSRCSVLPSARSCSSPPAWSGGPWRCPRSARSSPDVGVPAFRASIALREGVSLSFPGMASRGARRSARGRRVQARREQGRASSGARPPTWTASRSSRRAPRSTTSGARSAAWRSSRSR